MAVVPFDPYRQTSRRGTPPPQGTRMPLPVRTPVAPPAPQAAPALPRLEVNLSPAAATRQLAGLGLAVAVSATVATTLALVAAGPGGASPSISSLVVDLSNWLVSLPWLFLAVALFAVSRIERLTGFSSAAPWTALAVAAAIAAGLQVIGRDAVPSWTLATRAGMLLVGAAALSVLFVDFFTGPSAPVRAQIVGGVCGGLVAGLGPFAMAGATLLAAAERSAPLDLLLRGSDALLGLVLATFTVHAALVYVRDSLPDFSIALDTRDGEPGPVRGAPVAARH